MLVVSVLSNVIGTPRKLFAGIYAFICRREDVQHHAGLQAGRLLKKTGSVPT